MTVLNRLLQTTPGSQRLKKVLPVIEADSMQQMKALKTILFKQIHAPPQVPSLCQVVTWLKP